MRQLASRPTRADAVSAAKAPVEKPGARSIVPVNACNGTEFGRSAQITGTTMAKRENLLTSGSIRLPS